MKAGLTQTSSFVGTEPASQSGVVVEMRKIRQAKRRSFIVSFLNYNVSISIF